MELPAADKHGGTNKLFISIFFAFVETHVCQLSDQMCCRSILYYGYQRPCVQYQFSAVARHRAGVKLRNRLDGDLFLVCSHQDGALNHAC